MQVRWINDPVVRRDGIPGRRWGVVETRAGSRSPPEEACLKTTAPNVTHRMPPGARNGQACEAIARSVPPTEKSSGYGETATCRRVRPPGRRCQSRCAGRLSPTSRAWGLPRPPPLPSLLIPSRIRYYIGMCRTPRRLTLHINSWRSAWQTIC